MKFYKIFLSFVLIMFVILTYGCERGSDKDVEQGAGEVKTLTGSWQLTSSDGDSGPLEVKQFGKNIVGTFRGTNNPDTLFAISGTQSGGEISLEFSQGTDVVAKYEGRVTGNKMSGRWFYEDQSGTWEAVKK